VDSSANLVRVTFILLCAVALLLGVGASYFWLTETRGLALLQAAPALGVRLFLAIAALTTVNLTLRWLRWAFLLRRFHIRLPTRHTFLAFFATLPASFTPLYVGEMLRGLLLSWRRLPLLPVMLWVWVVERGSDAAALLVLWALAARAVVPALLGLLVLFGMPIALAYSMRMDTESARPHTAQLHPALVASACAGLSLIAWTLPVLGVALALHGFGATWSLTGACEAFARGTLLGGLSGIPGGFGIAGSEMISRLLDHGVSAAQATAAVIVLRLGTYGYALALGLLFALFGRNALLALLRARRAEQQHFDELSVSYARDIPEHVRQRLLQRKIDAMLSGLAAERAAPLRGLDLGCGHGWYAVELARRGYRMTGVDLSRGQVAQAEAYAADQHIAVELATYDGQHLEYPDATFDFVYCINVLHHVTAPQGQARLVAEALRVLKPGGRFFLHEMNVENPLFRVYMSYIFPLIKRIDEGTELWLLPRQLPKVPGGAWQPEVVYFTFLPEFIPFVGLRLLAPLEHFLEHSRFKRYAAHYMAIMRRC
jgi:2-polyprenyl-3-methyl-5-hydroxy-6-metoxy-1,4-benzoquinol methylase